MAKKKADEELEEIEEESEEEVETTEKEPKGKTKKLELDFEMDPVERLTKEIEFTDDPNEKAIGNFLLEEFKKDEVLKADYKAKKVALNKILDFVTNEAKKRVSKQTGAQCVMISDQEVFGMVIHYVHDEAIPSSNNGYTLSKEEKKALDEQAREEYLAEQKRKLEEKERKAKEKEEAARKKAIEKEKKKMEEIGQFSLFDDLDWGDGNES